MNQPFSRKHSGGLLAFVDRFQTSIEELGSLKSSYADDEVKLNVLTTTLCKVQSETSYYLDYIQDHGLDFSQDKPIRIDPTLISVTFPLLVRTDQNLVEFL